MCFVHPYVRRGEIEDEKVPRTTKFGEVAESHALILLGTVVSASPLPTLNTIFAVTLSPHFEGSGI